MKSYRYFTAESVTEGHPDKLCDQISDAIVDAILAHDNTARIACECTATRGLLLIAGEITTNCYVDIQKIARDTIKEIGYDREDLGFSANDFALLTTIDGQSPDIAQGVNHALDAVDTFDLGAGDQGMMFGYACDETPQHMPLALMLAHKLCRALADARKSGKLSYLRPDGKAQVTLAYDSDGNISHVDTVVLSAQHDPSVDIETLRADIKGKIILSTLPSNLVCENTKYYVNPTGRFVVGGPAGDTGLTGRKIIVDTYGGFAHHGGGAFSGKDPTKVDRSAAYAARHIARNLVAAGLAKRCEVSLAYAIGVARPVQIEVNTFSTGAYKDIVLAKLVSNVFDLKPAAIIERFGLRRPIYQQLASYGHFGRDELNLPWEQLDMIDKLVVK